VRPAARRAVVGLGIGCALAALASPARGQLALGQPPGRWGASAFAFYALGTDPAFPMAVLAADRGPLHLEARYNYEEQDTFSGWVGWAFTAGSELRIGVGPMVGAVVGELDGVAPGLRLAATWRRFSFYSEMEYVVALGEEGTSFFYNWSQWAWIPRDWLAVGVSVQRLRAVDSSRWVDVGPAAGVSIGRTTLQGFLFNPFSGDAYGLVGANVTF
jgi:hypothetical protein